MYTIFATAISSPTILMLTILYAITSSITVFDKRLIQAKRDGTLPPDEPMLPWWVGIIAWADWGIILTLLILNWKFALLLFLVKFILSVLPVLEIAGNIIMRPFRPKIKPN